LFSFIGVAYFLEEDFDSIGFEAVIYLLDCMGVSYNDRYNGLYVSYLIIGINSALGWNEDG
jgi:hypothetical protein